MRARMSWAHYPPSTQAHLHVHSLDPTVDPAPSADAQHPHYLKPGVFIVANHADELTPWTPVLSTLHAASGYLSIPCCAWSFDAKFERAHSHSASNPIFPVSVKDTSAEFVESLKLGGDGSNKSSYSMYRIWLAQLSLHCGWEIECETLRIPSTRNWALVGESRLSCQLHCTCLSSVFYVLFIGRRQTLTSGKADDDEMENAKDIVHVVRERGIFKARRPEGKAGDH